VHKQQFLTNFPLTIFATSKRKLQAHIRTTKERLLASSISGYALLFNDVLSSDYLTSIDPTKRQRSFGHIPVMWAWIAQVLEGNASCSKALGMIQSWYQSNGLPAPKGGSVLLMDTEANQLVYPQPSSQKPGCGFPAMGVVALLNHSHGGWEAFETCNARMRDTRVAPRMLKHLDKGDVLLADRAFCSYEFIVQLIGKGAHCVMRLHQARHRKLDWRKGKKISRNERIITWKKPKQQPATSDLTKDQWDDLPAETKLRYVRKPHTSRGGDKGYLIVVTDLLDHEKYCAPEVLGLYGERWEIELRFRDIKTTLGMEKLAVKTPEMAHKTLWIMMIAYNLVRSQMQEAAHMAKVTVWKPSFKAILDYITSCHESLRPLAAKQRKLRARLMEITRVCCQKLIDTRPGRREPRATKRRPKSYQLLTKPRHIFSEVPHRGNYYKTA
jgi:hypothetical protein